MKCYAIIDILCDKNKQKKLYNFKYFAKFFTVCDTAGVCQDSLSSRTKTTKIVKIVGKLYPLIYCLFVRSFSWILNSSLHSHTVPNEKKCSPIRFQQYMTDRQRQHESYELLLLFLLPSPSDFSTGM